MEIPLRTAYSQAGRCGMQPKAKHSLRAQAHQSKSRTETVKTETLEKKLRIREREERTREVREQNFMWLLALSEVGHPPKCLGFPQVDRDRLNVYPGWCVATAVSKIRGPGATGVAAVAEWYRYRTVACFFTVPSRYGDPLKSRRDVSSLVRLEKGEDRWEASDQPQGVLSRNWVEPNKIVLSPARCSELRLTTGVKKSSP
ncbi:hypothetical protein TNCV_4155441 [Trichonephila clavipes]|nr:hypothetical protein TNCV_4155441 [Trichonephila clavipes]